MPVDKSIVGGIRRAASKLQYRSLPLEALLPVANQLARSNSPLDSFIGQKMHAGILAGLGGEIGQKFPVCPNCGERHENPFASLIAVMKKMLTVKHKLKTIAATYDAKPA